MIFLFSFFFVYVNFLSNFCIRVLLSALTLTHTCSVFYLFCTKMLTLDFCIFFLIFYHFFFVSFWLIERERESGRVRLGPMFLFLLENIYFSLEWKKLKILEECLCLSYFGHCQLNFCILDLKSFYVSFALDIKCARLFLLNKLYKLTFFVISCVMKKKKHFFFLSKFYSNY